MVGRVLVCLSSVVNCFEDVLEMSFRFAHQVRRAARHGLLHCEMCGSQPTFYEWRVVAMPIYIWKKCK